MTLSFSPEIQITLIDESVKTILPPVVDRSFNTKKVVLIHTDDYYQDVIDLSKAYQKFEIESFFESISFTSNILELESELQLIVEKYKSPSLAVNVSNGSKLNAIALYNVAKYFDLPVYCVNNNDTISWLWPEVTDGIEIEDRVKIPTFLEANGFRYLSDLSFSKSDAQKKLLSWMIENIAELKKAISQLNYYAYSAGRIGISKPLQGRLDELKLVISKFNEAGLAELKNNRIHFMNDDVRFFANGGWLEEFIHLQISELMKEIPQIQDVRSSVEITSKLHNVRNEIDNMVLVNNQLFLIECKTKKFTDRGHPVGGAMDALYKMDTLMSELGGPIAKGMIISVYPFTQAEINRAKQYDIELVSFDGKSDVHKRLIDWFSN
jgi:hypothetical protein